MEQMLLVSDSVSGCVRRLPELPEATSPLCTTPGHGHLIDGRPDRPGEAPVTTLSEYGCSIFRTLCLIPGGSYDCKSFAVYAVTDYGLYHALR